MGIWTTFFQISEQKYTKTKMVGGFEFLKWLSYWWKVLLRTVIELQRLTLSMHSVWNNAVILVNVSVLVELHKRTYILWDLEMNWQQLEIKQMGKLNWLVIMHMCVHHVQSCVMRCNVGRVKKSMLKSF